MSKPIVPQLWKLKEMQRRLNAEGDFANAVNLVRSRGRGGGGSHWAARQPHIFPQHREVFIYSSVCPRIGQGSASRHRSGSPGLSWLGLMHMRLSEFLYGWGSINT